MHLTDGVLTLPIAAATTAAAGAVLVYSLKGIKEEEIPKLSLMTGAFFAVSLISIPIGPSSVHPMLGGLMGILLGRRAPAAFLVALLLHAVLLQHGGLTTLGVNTLLLALPALAAHRIFYGIKRGSVFYRGALVGGLAVAGTVGLLVLVLLLSDPRFGEGFFSVVNMLILGHLPLLGIEILLTGFAVRLLYHARPHLFQAPAGQINRNNPTT